MKKLFLTLIAAMVLPVLAMAQCPPSSATATVTLQFAGPGMLDGEFSVSLTKKVNFSKGNLQYVASTNKWRFADHQWDYIGNAAGNTTAEGSRATQSDSIDLFGWATSGSSKSNIYGYMPYYTTLAGINYGPGISSGEWAPENSDWGVVNAVQLGLGWHTLSKAEWEYLLGISSSKRANAANLHTHAIVHEVKGLILLPDGWTQANSRISTTLTIGTSFTSVSDEDWTILEYEGAVFLPAAGQRDQTLVVNNPNSRGYYWTSTAASTTTAYYLNFESASVGVVSCVRPFGNAVRLVK